MNELIGKKVIVYSDSASGERQDVGMLESADAQWVRLLKSGPEVLYFCIYSIRVIKPFDQ
jgi:hypothetical protein